MILRIIGFISANLLILVALGNGAVVLELPPFLIVLGTALGGGLMAGGPRTGSILRAIFTAEPAPLPILAGIRFLRTARFGALAGGFFTASGGMVLVMKDIDSPAALGPSMSLPCSGFSGRS